MRKIKYFWKFEGILLLTILFSLSLSIFIYVSFQKKAFNRYVNEQIDNVSIRITERFTHESFSKTEENLKCSIKEEVAYLNKLGIPLSFILMKNDDPITTNLNFKVKNFSFKDQGETLVKLALQNKIYLARSFNITPSGEVQYGVVLLYPEYVFINDIQDGITYIVLSQMLLLILGTIWVILLSNSFENSIKEISLLLQRSTEKKIVETDLYTKTSPEFSSLVDTFSQITENYVQDNETRLAKEKLDQELEIAHQIQDSFLTKSIPEFRDCEIVPYYDFAKEIGGDYYDVLHVDDEKVAIAIADVSGKGVPGSLIMVMIRSILRAEAFGKESPLSLIKKLNYLLMKDLRPGKFVTMIYSILDLRTHTLKVVNAGHLPLIVWRDKTKSIEEFNPEGIGLGLTNGKIFYNNLYEGTLKLNYNDIVVYFTDGITEAMNSEKEEYGEKRFLAAIKNTPKFDIYEFKKLLLKDIYDFIGDEPLSDDLTMVVLKMK
ncbi:serine/threonine-protein phosphatase [Candidatus Dependentiae bacterium]|nr:serine/threonine-protein phosphatase [Candidatus Dependentiae bacterium]